ncbi:MAG: ferrochelatase [Alphaproteobacteria bacterium]|nr:ferrochelatase [Alphaproteobacteria bacterium]
MKNAPHDHPPVNAPKVGVLILNLGTPEATDYWSMRRYLSEFLSDRRVIDYHPFLWQPLLQGVILKTRPFRSGHAYKQIWNKDKDESPLKTYTRTQAEKLAARLPGVFVEWGMRYGKPSTKAGIDSLIAQGCTKILLFALYPQYSASTTATAYDKAYDHLQTLVWQPAIRTAPAWYDDPAYIDLLAESVRVQFARSGEAEVVLCSFHGLPKRYLLQGDPYHCQCLKTSRLVREKLGLPEDRWITTFQSRFGPEEWLQPYTDKTLEALADQGVKHLAVISPAFVSECVETLEEINMGLRESFLEKGGERFTYIPCLNDDDAHMDFLAAKIGTELKGWVN